MSSPPKKGLQSVNEDSPILIDQYADTLHSMITKVRSVNFLGTFQFLGTWGIFL